MLGETIALLHLGASAEVVRPLQTVEAVGDELLETYEAKRAEWLGAIGADRTGR